MLLQTAAASHLMILSPFALCSLRGCLLLVERVILVQLLLGMLLFHGLAHISLCVDIVDLGSTTHQVYLIEWIKQLISLQVISFDFLHSTCLDTSRVTSLHITILIHLNSIKVGLGTRYHTIPYGHLILGLDSVVGLHVQYLTLG